MASHTPDEESIGAVIARLVHDAKDYGRAELRYYRALATDRIGDIRNAAIAGAIGATLGFAAVIALIVGLVLALAPVIGPLLATLVVVGVTLVVVALCMRAAIGWVRRAFRPAPGGKE